MPLKNITSDHSNCRNPFHQAWMLTAALLLVLLQACGTYSSEESSPQLNPSKGEQKKDTTVSLTDSQKRRIEMETKTITGVMPVNLVVKLKTPDDHLIGKISQVTVVNEVMFVLDSAGRAVYRYSLDGDFLGQVGHQGNGPGEYNQPSYMQRIWDDQIAVKDFGRLLVYNADGIHQFSLGKQPGAVISRGVFSWPEKDSYYATDPFTNHESPHLIQIYDYSDLEKPIPKGGFETNFPFDFGAKWGLTAFTWVGDKIWCANPYEGEIHVYSKDGTSEQVISLGRAEVLSYDYVVEIAEKYAQTNPSKFDKLMLEKELIISLTHVAPVVVMVSNKGNQIFSEEGKPLSGLMLPTLPHVLGTHGQYLIGKLHTLSGDVAKSAYETSLKHEYKLMAEQGFDYNQATDDIYLGFYKLVD